MLVFRRLIFFFCFFQIFADDEPICIDATSPAWALEVRQLERTIGDLQEKKRGIEMRALRHQNTAELLQFQNEELATSKRELEMAEEKRQIAQQLGRTIENLRSQRKQLLDIHRGESSCKLP